MSSKLRLQLRDYLLAFLVTNFVYLEVVRLVIHTNQIIIILKVKMITAYFLPRSCWVFMTNHWLFLLIWSIAHENSTITSVKELKNMCRSYHCFDSLDHSPWTLSSQTDSTSSLIKSLICFVSSDKPGANFCNNSPVP